MCWSYSISLVLTIVPGKGDEALDETAGRWLIASGPARVPPGPLATPACVAAAVAANAPLTERILPYRS